MNHWLYSFLTEESFYRLQSYVMQAAQYVGVGAKVVGDRQEKQKSTRLFCKTVTSTVVSYTNVSVDFWRDDNNQDTLNWFKTKFLDRLRHDEWYNILQHLKQGR